MSETEEPQPKYVIHLYQETPIRWSGTLKTGAGRYLATAESVDIETVWRMLQAVLYNSEDA